MIRIVAVDDERACIQKITKAIENYKFEDEHICYKYYFDADSVVKYAQVHNDIDIAFIDIRLKDKWKDGFFIAGRLKLFNSDTLIVFVSAHEDYQRAVNAEPFRFIDKEDFDKQFPEVMRDAEFRIYKNQKLKRIFFKYQVGKQYQYVNFYDIIYFYSDRRKIYYKLLNGREFGFYGKMDEIEEKLQKLFPRYFLRINKSYIVNLRFAVSFDGSIMEMVDGVQLSITYKKEN